MTEFIPVSLSLRFFMDYYPPTRYKSGERDFFPFIYLWLLIHSSTSHRLPHRRNPTMKTLLLVVAALFLLTASALGEQPVKGEVRSPSGKLLYKTITRGNQTEVRSPSGKLLIKSKTMNGTTETRLPSGKLLYKSK